MPKITYEEYLRLCKNPDTPDEVILSYSQVERGEGGFDYKIQPDPDKVDLSIEDIEFENAMQIGNGLARYRRQQKFKKRKQAGSNLPVLVSEGDSWFQFPLLVREIIDQLERDYLIWSVGAAGDTAQNMVYGRKPEYLDALESQKDDVRGFLFSAAGNDIIGEDLEKKEPVLVGILKKFNGNENEIEGHINFDLFNQKLEFLQTAYTTVISNVRANTKFRNLPIFIHGYDYLFPHLWGENDPRHPFHAKKDEWIGSSLRVRGFNNMEQGRNIIKFMIDKLYDMLTDVSKKNEQVWLVDCRGAMPEVKYWIDEIHGTSEGYEQVTDRFRIVMKQAGI